MIHSVLPSRRRPLLAGLCVLSICAGATGASSLESAPADSAASQPKAAMPPPLAPGDLGSNAQQYCRNIADAASDARIAWEMKQLNDTSAQIDQRIAALQAKEAEYQSWVTKREDMMKKAADGVVSIYSTMDPQAAALQLAALDDDTAAAVLLKLKARSAGAILGEMPADRAAHLAAAMAGTSSTPTPAAATQSADAGTKTQ